jgi:hypothetical protein
MIERDQFDHDVFTVSCDQCGEDQEVDSGGDWQDMINTIKDDGWTMRKIKDEWQHHCPSCTKDHTPWPA